MSSILEITGNWCEFPEFLHSIQTREPLVPEGEWKTFTQTLRLPTGRYSLRFLYEPDFDLGPERALAGAVIRCGEREDSLTFVEGKATIDFEVTEGQSPIALSLTWGNSRPPRTWLDAEVALPAESNWLAVPPADGQGEVILAHGIPFQLRRLDLDWSDGFYGDHPWKNNDRSTLRPWDSGMSLPGYDAPVDTAYFLGMIHNVDIANGSWYSRKNDQAYSHFVGDQAGEIIVHWSEGGSDSIPLIFGFNLWYGRPWDVLWHYAPYHPTQTVAGGNTDAALFDGEEEPRRIIRDGLALVDGMRTMGSRSCNARYIFAVDFGGRRVRSIEVKAVPELHGHPVISAVTFATKQATPGLVSLPDISAVEPKVKISALSAQPDGVSAIQHLIYGFIDELTKLTEPVIPPGYFGPGYDFQGSPEAVYTATYLYRNGPECGAHIADSGVGCSSPTARRATFHYTLGAGFWRTVKPFGESLDHWLKLYQEREPGQLPGRGSAWGRGIGELLRESMAFGYGKFVNSYLDWLDGQLFLDATPPHWVRIPGNPAHAREDRQVGDTHEVGNRENDGHGIIMWGRYLIWHWQGRPLSWSEDLRWKATEASADWIKWQLDTEALFPGKGKDVLYTESECAHGSYDIYSSYNCLHGLKLAIRMAKILGRTEAIARWQPAYDRLRIGILDELVDPSPEGPIWHTELDCDWQDHAHKLVHLQLASDGDTYTPLQDYALHDDLERRYLEISRNSYRNLMRDKNYDCLRMYGYGQGMMLQAALLLDEMADAEQFLTRLVTYAYMPQLEGWTAPEGIIVHRSGRYYVSVNGYMGQDAHLADSMKALRLLLGVDDNDPDCLRFVPRFPASWESMAINDYPVITGDRRQKCQYRYERTSTRQVFTFAFEHPVESLKVRLGPLPIGKTIASELPLELLTSGDSQWAWIELSTIQQGEIAITIAD